MPKTTNSIKAYQQFIDQISKSHQVVLAAEFGNQLAYEEVGFYWFYQITPKQTCRSIRAYPAASQVPLCNQSLIKNLSIEKQKGEYIKRRLHSIWKKIQLVANNTEAIPCIMERSLFSRNDI